MDSTSDLRAPLDPQVESAYGDCEEIGFIPGLNAVDCHIYSSRKELIKSVHINEPSVVHAHNCISSVWYVKCYDQAGNTIFPAEVWGPICPFLGLKPSCSEVHYKF